MKRLAATAVLAVLLCTSVARGQISSGNRDADSGALDCSQEFGTLDSCQSYSELVRAKDRRILAAFFPGETSLVCFRTTTDTFFVVTWPNPQSLSWVTSKAMTARKSEIWAPGIVEYHKYRNGISWDFRSWGGHWIREPLQRSENAYLFAKNVDGDLVVDPSEVRIRFRYENQIGTMTNYSLRIRRSTRRFEETFNISRKRGEDQDLDVENGHCLLSEKALDFR